MGACPRKTGFTVPANGDLAFIRYKSAWGNRQLPKVPHFFPERADAKKREKNIMKPANIWQQSTKWT